MSSNSPSLCELCNLESLSFDSAPLNTASSPLMGYYCVISSTKVGIFSEPILWQNIQAVNYILTHLESVCGDPPSHINILWFSLLTWVIKMPMVTQTPTNRTSQSGKTKVITVCRYNPWTYKPCDMCPSHILLNVFLRVYFCFSEILPLSVTKAHVMVSKINNTSVAETKLAEVSE